MRDSERDIALKRLCEARDEAVRVQLELDQIYAALAAAEHAGDGPAMAHWYAREAELLHRRAEIADHVSAIAAVLWIPGDLPGSPDAPERILH